MIRRTFHLITHMQSKSYHHHLGTSMLFPIQKKKKKSPIPVPALHIHTHLSILYRGQTDNRFAAQSASLVFGQGWLAVGVVEALVLRNYNLRFVFHDVGQVNEHYLFHGTKWKAVTKIYSLGLDFRVANEHALLGRGVYTAECPSKSDQYTGTSLEPVQSS